MDAQSLFARYRETQQTLHAYEHAMGVLYYDGVTGAPEAGAPERGKTLGILSGLAYDLEAGEETKALLAELKKQGDALTPMQKRELEVFGRGLEYASSIPKEEFVAYEVLCSDAEAVWHKAKSENDFASFAPYLEKLIDCNRRFALYYKPDRDPYDTLLDTYERGLDTKTCDRFFGTLKRELVPIISAVAAAEEPDTAFLRQSYPVAQQRLLSDRLMEIMGIDRRRCSIGETEHPFTTGFNLDDNRITTHYHEDDVLSSMFSVIHEGGHALYDMGSSRELAGTGLLGGVSMGIHESQSRFWENLIGRSREFCALVLPELRALFPTQLSGVTEEQFYRAANRSKPSLIRTEADELTYSLHVLLRYELEKELIGGTLAVKDLPAAWNEGMRRLLGVTVPDDTHGVLQDSHWSGGMFGYFPSYALGSAYGAQLLAKMEESFSVSEAISSGKLTRISDWLTDRIWRHGQVYDPGELLKNALNAEFDPGYYTDYLKRKFTDLYGL